VLRSAALSTGWTDIKEVAADTRFEEQGMVDVLQGALDAGEGLLRALVGVMALWFVVWTWARTRSLMPVLGAALVGAVVIWAVSVSGLNFLENRVNEDVNEFCDGCEGGTAGR
jgi:hypothetical protein